MKFLNKTVDNLNNNNLTSAVYIDFTKAFDSVNYKILSSKLKHYGIRVGPNTKTSEFIFNQ